MLVFPEGILICEASLNICCILGFMQLIYLCDLPAYIISLFHLISSSFFDNRRLNIHIERVSVHLEYACLVFYTKGGDGDGTQLQVLQVRDDTTATAMIKCDRGMEKFKVALTTRHQSSITYALLYKLA